MNRFKHKKTLFAASLLSWAMLFALPFLNGQINNGVEWVKLCTHTGIQYIAIESPESSGSQSVFDALDCPCIDSGLQQTNQFAYSNVPHDYYFRFSTVENNISSKHILLPPLRGPPIS